MKKRLFAFPLTVCILLCCILTALPAHAAGTGGESAVSSAATGWFGSWPHCLTARLIWFRFCRSRLESPVRSS